MARKGDDVPERPHRRAQLLSVPAELAPVPLEKLEELAEHVTGSEVSSTQMVVVPQARAPIATLDEPPVPMDEAMHQRLLSALSVISSDDYQLWIEIGMALESTKAGNVAFQLFNWWSSRSPKYKGSHDCLKHWRSFGSRSVEVTIATVFHRAKQCGWDARADHGASVYTSQEQSESESHSSYGAMDWIGATAESGHADSPGVVMPVYSAIPAVTPKPLPPTPATPPSSPFRDLWKDLSPQVAFEDAPPRQYLAMHPTGAGMLPLKVAGTLNAAGGFGKTNVVLQLAVSVATGRPWLGHYTIDPQAPKRVCLVLGEEDHLEVWRRIKRICDVLGLDDAERTAVVARIVVLPFAGISAPLLELGDRGVPTETHHLLALREQLIADARLDDCFAGGGWGLVVIDPLSRFAGIEAETSNMLGTRFVQACETLCDVPGHPTVLVLGHSSKASRRSGTVDSRGVTALTDGFRWAATLGPLVIEKEIEADRAVFEVPKNNYGPPSLPLILKRQEGGLLFAEDPDSARMREEEAEDLKLEKGSERGAERDAQDSYEMEEAIALLVDYVSAHPGVKKGILREAIGVRATKADRAIARAVATGALLESDGKRGSVLYHVAEDSTLSLDSPPIPPLGTRDADAPAGGAAPDGGPVAGRRTQDAGRGTNGDTEGAPAAKETRGAAAPNRATRRRRRASAETDSDAGAQAAAVAAVEGTVAGSREIAPPLEADVDDSNVFKESKDSTLPGLGPVDRAPSPPSHPVALSIEGSIAASEVLP
jgi:hypothetical protein